MLLSWGELGILGMSAIFYTQHRHLREVKTLEAEMERGERLAAAGNMAAAVAHEIRNPLNAVSTGIQGLRVEFEPAPREEYLRMVDLVQGEVRRLNVIVEEFLSLQVKLLRVLQEREFERVGSSRPIKVDVRLLAATHRDLEALVREGRFREDLYYRINVVTIMLPSLRERREDLPPLIEHFLRAFAGKNGKTVRGLTREAREAREALLRYDYPGNIRELENLMERAVVLTRDDVIGVEDLPLTLETPASGPGGEAGLITAVEGLERRMIRETLAKAHGTQTRAAELLGISERVLRYKLKKYGLS